jgi:hypothetical protein
MLLGKWRNFEKSRGRERFITFSSNGTYVLSGKSSLSLETERGSYQHKNETLKMTTTFLEFQSLTRLHEHDVSRKKTVNVYHVLELSKSNLTVTIGPVTVKYSRIR